MGDEKWDRRVGGGGRARQREGALIEWSASFWLVIQILCFFIIKRLSVLILLQDNLPFELSPLVNVLFFLVFFIRCDTHELMKEYAYIYSRKCEHSRTALSTGYHAGSGLKPDSPQKFADLSSFFFPLSWLNCLKRQDWLTPCSLASEKKSNYHKGNGENFWPRSLQTVILQ